MHYLAFQMPASTLHTLDIAPVLGSRES